MSNIKKFRIKSFKANKSILNLDKISLKFGRKIILDNLNLKLNNGQILGLLGPNGAGKSTIFNLITGLLSPDFGSIYINSKIVNAYPIYKRTLKFKIGFVPQYGGYFHDLTVYENLKAIAEITIDNESYRNEKIDSLISKFELDPIRDIKGEFLSGGQKKKLVIAIALISEPKILLLDEPTASLDPDIGDYVRSVIENFTSKNSSTILLASHNMNEVERLCDEVMMMKNGEIIDQGKSDNLINKHGRKNLEEVFLKIARDKNEIS